MDQELQVTMAEVGTRSVFGRLVRDAGQDLRDTGSTDTHLAREVRARVHDPFIEKRLPVRSNDKAALAGSQHRAARKCPFITRQ